ncbi:MAG TPA: histidine kinase, partial [Rugosimonospora sp.]|nr:histidine kinase [Rugosimonospora sp.]
GGRPPWAGGRPPWVGDEHRERRHGRPFLPIVIGLIQVFGTRAAQHNQLTARPLDVVAYALLLAGPVALLFRLHHRVPVLVVALAANLVYFLAAYAYGPVFLALLFAAGGAVIAGQRRAAWIAVGVGYALFASAGWLVHSVGGVKLQHPTLGGAVAVAAWCLVTLAVSEAVRNRTQALAEMARARAEQQRSRTEQQRRQASEERLRIAQELHDVLGHHLSLINVQAGVGLHLMDERPEQARAALAAIKQASAEALREVRAVLGVLRSEDEAAPRAPAPSLTNLSALIEGTTTRLVVDGQPRELPPELDRAAYRIAQEALTNVRRHAGTGATATVTIGYGPAALTVRVDDDGGGPAGDLESGSGLAGMRARAAALGGTLGAGAGPAGGFRVEAVLPVPGCAGREGGT